MTTWSVLMSVMALQIANSPLYLDPTSDCVRALRNAGFQIEGQDPCYGSGLCCALLPANTNDEVHYVTLPRGLWSAAHIRLLSCFANLKQVRANREATAAEYDFLCQACGDESLVPLHVRRADGTVVWTGINPGSTD